MSQEVAGPGDGGCRSLVFSCPLDTAAGRYFRKKLPSGPCDALEAREGGGEGEPEGSAGPPLDRRSRAGSGRKGEALDSCWLEFSMAF